MHLEQTTPPTSQESDPWTAERHEMATPEEIRYESYFDEIEKETGKEDDNLKKDVRKQ